MFYKTAHATVKLILKTVLLNTIKSVPSEFIYMKDIVMPYYALQIIRYTGFFLLSFLWMVWYCNLKIIAKSREALGSFIILASLCHLVCFHVHALIYMVVPFLEIHNTNFKIFYINVMFIRSRLWVKIFL